MNGVFQGVPAAGGRGAGRVHHFVRRASAAEGRQGATAQVELHRFDAAHRAVIADLQRDDTNSLEDVAELRAAHLLILQDPALIDAVHIAMETRGVGAIAAVQEATLALSATIAALDDPYFAARAADVRDAGARLTAALTGVNPDAELDALPPDTILVSDDLTPSQVARLDAAHVRGIVLRRGPPLAHAAILAHGMGIPMVCGVTNLRVGEGATVAVDGDDGSVSLIQSLDAILPNPLLNWSQQTPARSSTAQAFLQDGSPVTLLGNANSLAELVQLARAGVGGVGLLRTEFLFPRHVVPPTLDEQTALFASLLAVVPDGVFTVRALDAGGDKEIPWLNVALYPAMLGRLGVRLLLAEPELLRTQYRALLRALKGVTRSALAPRLLLPMVTSAEEIVRVRALLDVVAHEEDSATLALGAMIEAPAAVFGASQIAQVCDFLSIGTNDLAHFLFATQRAHADPDHLADPLHPSVLRAIAMTCNAAQRHGIPVTVCGEVAGNPLAAPLLVGLGVSELSLRASSAPLVHAALGRYTQEQCRAMAQVAILDSGPATIHPPLRD